MPRQGVVLVGLKGFVEGEEHPLEYGQTVTIGRSRRCDICLCRSKKWAAMKPADRALHPDFMTVSRSHARISYQDDNWIEIQDTSANGTFVDGKRISKIVIGDIKQRSHEMRIGNAEVLRLEWRE